MLEKIIAMLCGERGFFLYGLMYCEVANDNTPLPPELPDEEIDNPIAHMM
jgi:hypothetical protein